MKEKLWIGIWVLCILCVYVVILEWVLGIPLGRSLSAPQSYFVSFFGVGAAGVYVRFPTRSIILPLSAVASFIIVGCEVFGWSSDLHPNIWARNLNGVASFLTMFLIMVPIFAWVQDDTQK